MVNRPVLAAVSLAVFLIFMPAAASATALVVSRPDVSGQTIAVEVQWQNGWRTARNHDAVWLFVKTGRAGTPWRHVRLASAGHVVETGTGVRGDVLVPDDRVGVFVVPSSDHRGAVKWRVRLIADRRDTLLDEVRVFGVEMVSIAEGGFTLGDPDPVALDFSAVYRSDARGEPDGLFHVGSENAIDVGPRAGALFYRTQLPQYEGDRLGPIPAAFPKGVAPFYAMKYEITQGDYAAFLNTLSGQAAAFRAIHGGRDYASSRGTIRLDGTTYVAASPARPANWISWNDGLAFADWAGLRPMTEFEFTKACRGPSIPIAREFPWGTATPARLKRVMGPDDDLVTAGDADEATLTDATRDVLGASYYWVMDLAGSVWERVITFGHPRGRAFRGSHGDGRLAEYGDATNDDWPLGDADAGGYGYRGGGYYERGMQPREFNPYSPIAYRRYGSWGGGPRSIAYGFRAVRSQPRPRLNLEAELRRIASSAPGTLGAAVIEVESGTGASVNASDWFPMMSVYKLPIVIHALRAAAARKFDLDARVTLTTADRRPGLSPLSRSIEQGGPQTLTARELLSSVIRISDNAASDRLLRDVGGPAAVAATMRELGISGIDVSRYEAEFAADYYGVPRDNPFSMERFVAAVEKATDAQRRRAAAAYLTDRRDSAQPAAMATLLARLVRGELLRPPDTAWLIAEMSEMHTRDTRLRAGLPPGTFAALRPGTSGETGGVRAAHNDNAIVRLPDGRHLAIAAFLKGSRGTEEERDAVLASVARAAYAWAMGQ